MLYEITVVRTGYSTVELSIEADSEEEACDIAEEQAKNMELKEHSSEYEVYPTKGE